MMNAMRNRDDELLNLFNDRKNSALGEIYMKYHKELIIYASILYRGTEVSADDVVHDVFVSLWSSKTSFSSLESIKAYCYVAVLNRFKNYLTHNKHIKTYTNFKLDNVDYDINVIESELYSFVNLALKVLPKLYADVIKLYIDGWKLTDIAVELNKSEDYIYKIKHDALKLLRKKINKDKMLIILMILGQVH